MNHIALIQAKINAKKKRMSELDSEIEQLNRDNKSVPKGIREELRKLKEQVM